MRVKESRLIRPVIASLLIIVVLVWDFGVIPAQAVSSSKCLEIQYQGRFKSSEPDETENAVPQSMAGNGNTIYLLKHRKSKNPNNLEDRSYIVKILDANTNSPKLVLPYDAAYVGHGGGMTYYNGYLYVAHGEAAVLYRVKEENSTTQTYDPSTRWERGTIKYAKKTMNLSGLTSGEIIRNIAHYSGDYFIVGLTNTYSEKINTITYGVGQLSGTNFTIMKRFKVVIEDTYGTTQDIDYNNGYLWTVLYGKSEAANHIVLAEIPTSYDAIENGKTYKVRKKIKIDKNEAGRSSTVNELESVYVYGANYYTWSNIIDTRPSGQQQYGWNETFCRYPLFPEAVSISSITTNSKSSLTVNWTQVSNADQYRIDRRKQGEEFSTIATVDSSKTSFKDTGLQAGTMYYYRVYGVNSGGASPKKDGVFGVTRTNTPKVDSVTAISESELKVKWNVVTGAKKYIVCRKKEGSGEGWQYYSRIGETTGTEYQDKNLEPNKTYDYGIIAVTETEVESGDPNDNGNPGSDNRKSGKTLEAIGITLNQSSINLVETGSYDLNATVTPAYAANSTIIWTVDNSSIASVDQAGKVTALKPGIAVITATESMKKKTAKCIVTVEKNTIQEISIETLPSRMEYIKGETLDTEGLIIKALYKDGTSRTVNTGYNCTPMQLDTVGTQEIEISYEGMTVTFEVIVKERVEFEITSQPEDTEAKSGERIVLNVEATGEALTYQWQYKNATGTSWNNCRSVGYNTDTFSFLMKASLDRRQYRCVVTNGSEKMITDVATISLKKPDLIILSNPDDIEAAEGEKVRLHIEANGDNLQYRWQYKTATGNTWKNCNSSGYNTDTFSFAMKKSLDGRKYRCVVTSGDQKVVSDQALISLLKTALIIIKQPENHLVTVGEQVNLHVEAEGNDISYQWQWKTSETSWKNCVSLGNNTDTFSFLMKVSLDGRQYRCVLSDASGNTVSTEPATIEMAMGSRITKSAEESTGGAESMTEEAVEEAETVENNEAMDAIDTLDEEETIVFEEEKEAEVFEKTEELAKNAVDDETEDYESEESTEEAVDQEEKKELTIVAQKWNDDREDNIIIVDFEVDGDNPVYRWEYYDETESEWRDIREIIERGMLVSFEKENGEAFTEDSKTVVFRIGDAGNRMYVRCVITDQYGMEVISEELELIAQTKPDGKRVWKCISRADEEKS